VLSASLHGMLEGNRFDRQTWDAGFSQTALAGDYVGVANLQPAANIHASDAAPVDCPALSTVQSG